MTKNTKLTMHHLYIYITFAAQVEKNTVLSKSEGCNNADV